MYYIAHVLVFFVSLGHSANHQSSDENCVVSSNRTSGGQQTRYKVSTGIQRAEWHGKLTLF